MLRMHLLRERLTLVLLVLLPLHAFLVTVLTKLVAGPAHAPLPALAFWKEGLITLIIALAFAEWIKAKGYRKPAVDLLDWFILGFAVLSLAVTALNGAPSKAAFLLGVKYDLFPLCMFLILRRVPWSDQFKTMAMAALLLMGGLVSLYGIVSFFLPIGFFTVLGYADLHSLFLPDGPLAPFQQIGGTALHRVQSTMSGPNQLGIWLLIPLSIGALAVYCRKSAFNIVMFLLPLAALLLTFSRAAWIGAAVMLATLAILCAPQHRRRRIALQGAGAIVALSALAITLFPSVLLRAQSTAGHLERPIAGIRAMLAHPLGQGLGTAGPATNRVSDACVELEGGSDASWAGSHPNLCVFVGGAKVQPLDRDCRCPFVTENWYVQVGVETGVIGFALFIILMVALLRALRRNGDSLAPFVALLGISICALFLHAFEDSAVAYTAFFLAAFFLSPKRRDSQR